MTYQYEWTPTIVIKADGLDSANWAMRLLREALEQAGGKLHASYGEFHGIEIETSIMDLHHAPKRDGSLRS